MDTPHHSQQPAQGLRNLRQSTGPALGDHSAQTATSVYPCCRTFPSHYRRPEPGIIGDNGAAKSTLLKLLVGTLQLKAGAVQLNGQVAALLELGAGFHPEFTGRRNIYLNASLLGVPDSNIAELEKDIIEFSELDYFIDRPVKTYSSGMYVQLAFSIATMVRPTSWSSMKRCRLATWRFSASVSSA